MLDVTAEIEILAEPTDIASVMFDPQRDPEWVQAVKTVEVIDTAIKPGARVRRTGEFFGQTIQWTTEVVAFQFPHVLELRVIEGPFTGTVTYQVGRAAGGSVARIRAVGTISALGSFPDSAVVEPMRQAVAADLGRLKTIVEPARSDA